MRDAVYVCFEQGYLEWLDAIGTALLAIDQLHNIDTVIHLRTKLIKELNLTRHPSICMTVSRDVAFHLKRLDAAHDLLRQSG